MSTFKKFNFYGVDIPVGVPEEEIQKAVEEYLGGLSPLKGKTVVFFGDSICQGAENNGGYAKPISEITGCVSVNNGVSGSTVSTSGTSTTKIVNTVSSFTGSADYIVVEGMTNDYNQNCPLGTVEPALNSTLDITTFCGALESIYRDLIARYTSAKLFGVITHKSTSDTVVNSNGVSKKQFAEAFETVCEKYSIPYYNAYKDSGMVTAYAGSGDGFVTKMIADMYTVNGDKTHPNTDGYMKYYVPQIISMLETGIGSGSLKGQSDVSVLPFYQEGIKVAEINGVPIYVPSGVVPTPEETIEVALGNTGFVRNNGTISTSASGRYTGNITLDGVKKLIVSVGGYASASNVAFYDASNTFLSDLSIVIQPVSGVSAYRYESTIDVSSGYEQAHHAVVSSYHSATYDAQYSGDNNFESDRVAYVKAV